jgi:polyhydroxybutyrate depolymerase
MGPLLPWLTLLACGTQAVVETITLEEGSYSAVVPAGWDGDSALPTAFHFHGAGGSPEQYTGAEDVLADYAQRGVLLLLPEGEDGHWRTDPGWGGRDEYAFTADVLADAGERWPVDEGRVYATGFSVGGALVANIGCDHSEAFAAVAPISGGFWLPAPESCGAEPVPVSHTHGEADTTWPIDGRCFREGEDGECEAGQAPLEDDIQTWLGHLGCEDEPREETIGPLRCQVWDRCESGDELRLCLHDEGHTRLDGWAGRQLDWLLQFER